MRKKVKSFDDVFEFFASVIGSAKSHKLIQQIQLRAAKGDNQQYVVRMFESELSPGGLVLSVPTSSVDSKLPPFTFYGAYNSIATEYVTTGKFKKWRNNPILIKGFGIDSQEEVPVKEVEFSNKVVTLYID